MTDNPKITLEQIEARCTPQVYERGEVYFKGGAITDMRWNGRGIDARCRGSHGMTYRVSVLLKDDDVVWTHCDCPYRYEGDCKHAIALLLTYLHHPEQVTPPAHIAKSRAKLTPPPISTPKPITPPSPTVTSKPPVISQNVPLRERPHHELVQLIHQMMQRYPDLEEIVNPLPPSSDMIQCRDDLKRAFFRYDDMLDEEWTARELMRLATVGDDFAGQGEWMKASGIYTVIVEEFVYRITPHRYRLQGFFTLAINAVVVSMGRCMTHLSELQARLKMLYAWSKLWAWQVRYNYPEMGGDVLTLLYAHIQSDEVPPIRRWLKSEMNLFWYGQTDASTQYERCLRVLALIRSQKLHRLVQELTEQGMLHSYIKRLLIIGQVDEVKRLFDTEHLSGQQQVAVLDVLWSSGYETLAMQSALEWVQHHWDGDVIVWGMQRCERHRQYQSESMLWMCLYVRYTRQMRDYDQLKQIGIQQNRWDEVYQALITDVERSGDKRLLVEIYVHDEKWDLAWRVVRQAEALPEWANKGLDLYVARASGHDYPERAIPILLKYAHEHIAQRNREGYEDAVRLLLMVQELYEQQDEYERWEQVIARIRMQYKGLRLLKEALEREGL